MKPFITFSLSVLAAATAVAQCTTTNATSCICADGTSNCMLLPDITVSWQGIANNGYTEYPQTGAGTNYTGQGPDDGRLRITASTPNIGHGSFTVRGQDPNGMRTFVCGTDTFYNVPAATQFTCPNGEPNARQLITQRIYHKNGNAMTYTDVYAGSMTYHPNHGHNHVDDWAVLTLRIATADPDPRNWPIVGTGAKIGFCLMDYGQCGTNGSTYDGHCRDNNTVYQAGTVLHNTDFPNWNLGGGNYSCSVVEQGISSGWTDVYGKHLDGMWINIPPNTCNGDYYIVAEVDANNNFLEENEDNNYTAVPITLSLQHPAGTQQTPTITALGSNNLCLGDTVTLMASGGTSFLWSTGETTQRIRVAAAGNYTCEVSNYCGTYTSDVFTVRTVVPNPPTVQGDTLCVSGSATLTASSTGVNRWYDAQGNFVLIGDTLQTPAINASVTYYVESTDTYMDTLFSEPHTNNAIGGGGYLAADHYEVFNALQAFTLRSVLIYAESAGTFTVELQDSMGNVFQSMNASVPAGASRLTLNFSVPAGQNLRLAASNINAGTGLYRNNNASVYPYTLPGVLRITGASSNNAYFYYFYDWEVVTANGTCASARTAVTAVVDPCLGIKEEVIFDRSISVMPNPSKGQFNLRFFVQDQAQDVQIQVFNVMGQLVHQMQMPQAQGWIQEEISLLHLSKGVYMLNVQYKGQAFVKRLIIE